MTESGLEPNLTLNTSWTYRLKKYNTINTGNIRNQQINYPFRRQKVPDHITRPSFTIYNPYHPWLRTRLKKR